MADDDYPRRGYRREARRQRFIIVTEEPKNNLQISLIHGVKQYVFYYKKLSRGNYFVPPYLRLF
jgi:hypothetical protein